MGTDNRDTEVNDLHKMARELVMTQSRLHTNESWLRHAERERDEYKALLHDAASILRNELDTLHHNEDAIEDFLKRYRDAIA